MSPVRANNSVDRLLRRILGPIDPQSDDARQIPQLRRNLAAFPAEHLARLDSAIADSAVQRLLGPIDPFVDVGNEKYRLAEDLEALSDEQLAAVQEAAWGRSDDAPRVIKQEDLLSCE